jgi:two-component system, cell cycle sensor histidine kinase and response regulator CckA
MLGLSAPTGEVARPLAAPDYRAKITAIRANLSGSRIEMIGRFVLPGLGVALIAALLSDMVLVLVYLFFLLTQAMLYGFIRTRRAQCSRGDYGMVLCLAALTSAAFVAVAMYMWSTDALAAQFAAYCLVQGFALYGLTRTGPIIELIFIDTLPIVVASLFASADLARALSPQVHPAVTMAVGLMILAYYLACLYNVFDTRAKLRLAEDRAIAAERLEAVGRLTGGVAHDFNNILTAVLGHLDLYSHLGNQAEKDASVASAHEAATRAARLTGQLLFFARKARLQAVETDLTAYLSGFAGRARDILPATITLQTDLNDQMPMVMVDRTNLETVLLQLILNARDCMDQVGALTLGLDQKSVPQPRRMQGGTSLSPGTYCVIRITDHGTGISPENLGRIFEPFFTTKGKGQASGLGLSMTAGFAEQSGGAVSVSSEVGVGTVVELYLPVL